LQPPQVAGEHMHNRHRPAIGRCRKST